MCMRTAYGDKGEAIYSLANRQLQMYGENSIKEEIVKPLLSVSQIVYINYDQGHY